MFKSSVSLGININNASIEMVAIDTSGSQFRIIAAARTQLPEGAITQGVIINTEQVCRALRSLRAQCHITERATCDAAVSISDFLAFPFFTAIDPAHQTASIPQLLIDTANKTIPIPQNERQDFILHPLPARRAFGYSMRRKIYEGYISACAAVRINCTAIESDNLALARFVMPEKHKVNLFTLVDIGADVTHITAIYDGYTVASMSIPFGAEYLQTRFHTEIRGQRERLHIEHITEAIERQALLATFTPYINQIKQITTELKGFIASAGIPDSSLHMLCAGGGSLLPHIIEYLQAGLKEIVHAAHMGAPCDTSAIPKNDDVALYSHAIGSAFMHRTTNSIKPQPLGSLTQAQSSHLSLFRFKKRTSALIGIFAILLIILIVLAISTFARKPEAQKTGTNATPISIPPAQSTKQEDDSTLDIFGVTFKLQDGFALSKQEISRTQKKDVSATGKRDETGRASGIVTIINSSNEPKSLVKFTRLQTTNNSIFRIQEQMTVPANGKQQVKVVADALGAEGNIAPGRLTIPGLNPASQALVYAENEKAFSGGITAVSVLTEADITEATKQLQQTLADEITTILPDESKEGQTIVIDPTIHYTAVSDPAVDSVTPSATVTVTGIGYGVAFDQKILDQKMRDKLGNVTFDHVSYSLSSFNPETGEGVLVYSIVWRP